MLRNVRFLATSILILLYLDHKSIIYSLQSLTPISNITLVFYLWVTILEKVHILWVTMGHGSLSDPQRGLVL